MYQNLDEKYSENFYYWIGKYAKLNAELISQYDNGNYDQ